MRCTCRAHAVHMPCTCRVDDLRWIYSEYRCMVQVDDRWTCSAAGVWCIGSRCAGVHTRRASAHLQLLLVVQVGRSEHIRWYVGRRYLAGCMPCTCNKQHAVHMQCTARCSVLSEDGRGSLIIDAVWSKHNAVCLGGGCASIPLHTRPGTALPISAGSWRSRWRTRMCRRRRSTCWHYLAQLPVCLADVLSRRAAQRRTCRP